MIDLYRSVDHYNRIKCRPRRRFPKIYYYLLPKSRRESAMEREEILRARVKRRDGRCWTKFAFNYCFNSRPIFI